jgi:DNA-binding protein YbaB
MPQPDMQKVLKQVQKMQADMQRAQEELKTEVVEATAGGGVVTVEITDVEMLSDLIQAAINQGLQAAQELQAQRMADATGGLGGLGGPGGLGGLGLPGF